MIKFLCAGIWAGLCACTIVLGEATVFNQAMAQGSLAIILAIAAYND